MKAKKRQRDVERNVKRRRKEAKKASKIKNEKQKQTRLAAKVAYDAKPKAMTEADV